MTTPETPPDSSTSRSIVRGTNGKEFIGTAGAGSHQSVNVFAMPAWQLVMVRTMRTFIDTTAGALGVDGTGLLEITPDGGFIAHLGTAMLIGLAAAIVSLLKNTGEFLADLDTKRPMWRA